MGLIVGGAIESRALLEPNGDFGLTGEIDDLLHSWPADAFGDENAIEGSPGLECFPDRVDADDNAHRPMLHYVIQFQVEIRIYW